MINTLKVVLITILTLMNLLLLAAMIYSAKSAKDNVSKFGFGFSTAVIILDMAFMIGGALL